MKSGAVYWRWIYCFLKVVLGMELWGGLSFFGSHTPTGKQNLSSQSPLYGIRVEANTFDSGASFLCDFPFLYIAQTHLLELRVPSGSSSTRSAH